MGRKLSYKAIIAREYIQKFSNASTNSIARMLIRDYPIDFDNFEQARGIVRHQRGEIRTHTVKNPIQIRSEETKKKFMIKQTDLPQSDYSKVETFVIPKGQNNILLCSRSRCAWKNNAC